MPSKAEIESCRNSRVTLRGTSDYTPSPWCYISGTKWILVSLALFCLGFFLEFLGLGGRGGGAWLCDVSNMTRHDVTMTSQTSHFEF